MSVWKDSNYNNKISKVLVIGISDNRVRRHLYEDTLAAQFNSKGVHAVSLSSLLPGDDSVDRETVKSVIKEKGFNAVLVTRLVGVETRTEYVHSMEYTVPHDYYFQFGGFYANSYTSLHQPGYMVNDKVVTLETNLYNATIKSRPIS